MALISISNIKIKGISACVPLQSESNTDISFLSESEKSIFINHVGIRERRIAPKEMRASDLCYSAALKLMEKLNWQPQDIDFLIFVTQTPDHKLPGTSMQLQDRLGIPKRCMAFDINQGCAGFVYGLASMASILSHAPGKKGLLLVGDTITHLIENEDPSLEPIFSDAGTCTALEYDHTADSMHFNLMSDGSRFDAIMVVNNEKKESQNVVCAEKLVMQGHEVFKFGLEEIAPNVAELLKQSNTDVGSIDYLVMHQANKLLNEAIRKKIGFAENKVPYSLDRFGNTSCSTIPLTIVSNLSEAISDDKRTLLLCGFGVGLSWGSVILQLDRIECPELIEI